MQKWQWIGQKRKRKDNWIFFFKLKLFQLIMTLKYATRVQNTAKDVGTAVIDICLAFVYIVKPWKSGAVECKTASCVNGS